MYVCGGWGPWGPSGLSSQIRREQVDNSVARPFSINKALSEHGVNTFIAPLGNAGVLTGPNKGCGDLLLWQSVPLPSRALCLVTDQICGQTCKL